MQRETIASVLTIEEAVKIHEEKGICCVGNGGQVEVEFEEADDDDYCER